MALVSPLMTIGTFTAAPLAAAERVTEKLAVSPSVIGALPTSSSAMVGRSVMVPVAVARSMLALLGAERVTVKASCARSASALMGTSMVLLRSPAAKFSVPEVSV